MPAWTLTNYQYHCSCSSLKASSKFWAGAWRRSAAASFRRVLPLLVRGSRPAAGLPKCHVCGVITPPPPETKARGPDVSTRWTFSRRRASPRRSSCDTPHFSQRRHCPEQQKQSKVGPAVSHRAQLPCHAMPRHARTSCVVGSRENVAIELRLGVGKTLKVDFSLVKSPDARAIFSRAASSRPVSERESPYPWSLLWLIAGMFKLDPCSSIQPWKSSWMT